MHSSPKHHVRLNETEAALLEEIDLRTSHPNHTEGPCKLSGELNLDPGFAQVSYRARRHSQIACALLD